MYRLVPSLLQASSESLMTLSGAPLTLQNDGLWVGADNGTIDTYYDPTTSQFISNGVFYAPETLG